MSVFYSTLLYLVGRYLHIVSATFLVGGTLFYEMVVPIAINELRPEQQLLVFARARWVFKWIVWASAAIMLFSGALATKSHWQQYANDRFAPVNIPSMSNASRGLPTEISPAGRSGWWWAAHASTGTIALMIAVSLTVGNVPPTQPIRWMRLNLMILLLVMFLGTATRHARVLESQFPAPVGNPGELVNP